MLDAGPAATGVLFASYAVAMVMATFAAGRAVDRYGPRSPLLVGLVGLTAATLLFAVGGPYWLLLVARFCQGVAGGMSWVASLSLIAATTPSVPVTVAVLVGATVLSSLEPVLPVHLGTSALSVGLLFGLASLAGVIANPLVGSCVGTVSARLLTALGLASVVAAYNLAYAGGMAVGPLLTGFGVQQLGFTTALVVAAVVLAVLGGTSLTRLPSGVTR